MKTEFNHIEDKRELTDDLEKEVVAFLNYRDVPSFLRSSVGMHMA